MNDADYKINSFLKQEIKVVQELKGNLLNSTPGFPFDHEMKGSLNMLCCPKDISEFSITLPSLLSEKTKLSVSISLSLLIYTRKQKWNKCEFSSITAFELVFTDSFQIEIGMLSVCFSGKSKKREPLKKNILRKEENQNKLKQVYFIKKCHLLQILSKMNKNGL